MRQVLPDSSQPAVRELQLALTVLRREI